MAKYTMLKQAGGIFAPANDIEAERLKKLKTGKAFSFEVKQIQNYKLHQRIFSFFIFCTQYYYGDEDVTEEQLEFTRGKLTMSAGYVKQIFYPDGLRFELKPESISYNNMSPEERSIFYTKVTNAAMRNIFQGCDQQTIDRLYSFF